MSASDSPVLSDDVLDRYLAGQSSRAERDLVARWVGDDPTRKDWLRAVAAQSRFAARETSFDLDAMTVRLEARMTGERAYMPGSSASPLQTSSGTTIRTRHSTRGFGQWVAGVAAAGLVAILVVFTSFDRSAPAMREIVTRAGERAKLQLADGTRVLVGPNTKLRYPAAFGSDRTVLLDRGIAYFDVTHDPSHPFSVQTPTAVAQDLGTAFSVSANMRDTSVRVVVADGRVALRHRSSAPDHAVLLSRGDLGVLWGSISDDRTTVQHATDVTQAMGWINGRLKFTATPLGDVLRELEQWYDVKIDVRDSTLLRDGVTGTFDGESVDDILAQLSTVSNLRVERSGDRVTLVRSGAR